MEDRLRPGPQRPRRNRLGDPIGHGRHPERPRAPTVCLGYLHRQHRRRKVGPRRHPIPDLVQVAPKIGLEVGDGLPIHPSGTLVVLDLFVRLPHQLFRNHERLVRRI
jgi:hypothetical protein